MEPERLIREDADAAALDAIDRIPVIVARANADAAILAATRSMPEPSNTARADEDEARREEAEITPVIEAREKAAEAILTAN